MGEERPRDAKSIRLVLRVPCDTRFRPVLTLMCERMAAYVGLSGVDAAELSQAVTHATDGVLDHREAPEYTSLDVTFATTDDEIEIRVCYLCNTEDGSSADRPGIEHLLGSRRDAESPLDLIRRVMQRVEFGRSNDVEFCTLSKPLPEAQ